MHCRRLNICFILVFLVVGFACQKPSPERVLTGNPKIDKLKIPEGFVVEHLYSPGENGQGSWVALTFDDKGRMIAADQYGFLYRLTFATKESEEAKPQVEKLIVGNVNEPQVGMGYAQGLLYAFNSLYVMVNHNPDEVFSKATGLYRIQDMDGDDAFETVTEIKTFSGLPGEHGPHSMKLSPDGKSIVFSAGNHVDVPVMDHYRLPKVWDEDNLFPLIKDPRGHANDREAPGGWIAQTDPEGKEWELIAAGFRNEFDIAFNEVGDLFTYDSDMEWDFGMPWYRPTRINHVTSGAEFGWRTGNAKWAPHYPDNLPAVLNIGQGSPTNVMFGTEAKFPSRYRSALFAFDWSFGIIYAVHLSPKGGSYEAKAEEFISGSPLPLTDGTIGPDGALYFATGGRRLDSDVYRVSYEGDLDSYQALSLEDMPEEAILRRKLEQYHAQNAAADGLDLAWEQLNHPDRFVRYAARLVLEHQPLDAWRSKALTESDPVKKIQAALAFARHGKPADATSLVKSLLTIEYAALSLEAKQDLLRTFEVILYRFGKATASVKQELIRYLSPHFPAEEFLLDRSLSVLLVYLEAPEAVAKTLMLLQNAKDDPDYQKTFTSSSELIFRNPQYGLDIASMLANVPPAQATYFATVLGGARVGWTADMRTTYFTWIKDALTRYKGGRSYVGFLDRTRKMALGHVPAAAYEKFNELSGASLLTSGGNEVVEPGIQPEGPGRNWSVEEALQATEELSARDFVRGKALYQATHCQSCHRMQGEGGTVGPDLSQVGRRFSKKDLLEAIIHPNAVISEQYHATVLELKAGGSLMGRLTDEDAENYYLSQNPFAPAELRAVPKREVSFAKKSEVSIMLPGLINPLNEEELKDLMAYLLAGGLKNSDFSD